MTEDARATTVLLVGAMMVRLALTGAYAKYVRTGMGGVLLAAGILLVALGLAGVARALGFVRSRGDAHGHGHGHGDRAGWLLLGPVLALLLVTPPALGSFGVGRSAAVDVSSGGRTFDPLPAGRTVPMTLLEFDERAADHGGASFGATPVRLTGFVTPASDRTGFRIARYQIACCAADAVAAVVRVTGTTGNTPARDQWVTVTGTFQRSADGVPELRATSLGEITAPRDPYE
ncbi:TIGR03943 family protein [Actinoallomurus spadix]|uniref:TIGR03943 family protein n=1 Tax=Actinoallomurus spadix TaxID=79912 RepID=A0ABN0XA56_9ACTN|nr:TIGR03943 family protein [Actinoallomurus spadix]MCO5987872.1 TIGR03943 family protein [Actinoallomurus spadix]